MNPQDESDGRNHDIDDAEVERLLGAVGRRAEAPVDLMEQVRRTVHAEWRVVVEARQRRRRLFAYGIAASGILALLVTASLFMLTGTSVPVATIARLTGVLEASEDGSGEWRRLTVGDSVSSGEVLRAGVDARAALNFDSGLQLRVDAGSSLELENVHRVSLSRGAVYVDADPMRIPRQELTVQTVQGAVSHIGTQFEVRGHGRLVEISVREGSVRLSHASGDKVAAAGEQLRLMDGGRIERTRISAQDPRWQWAAQVTPEFKIEGSTLSQFLRWAARETGRELTYTSPEAEAAAQRIVLHGSVGALPPDAALSAVLSTTALSRVQTKDELLAIALSTRD
jgi:ferric-dicitrate binding protein FerR (iron transport regulator)